MGQVRRNTTVKAAGMDAASGGRVSRMVAIDCYVYLVIMYSVHVELAVSPVNAGYLVRTVSLCYT